MLIARVVRDLTKCRLPLSASTALQLGFSVIIEAGVHESQDTARGGAGSTASSPVFGPSIALVQGLPRNELAAVCVIPCVDQV